MNSKKPDRLKKACTLAADKCENHNLLISEKKQ